MTLVRRKSVSLCIECMNIFILVFSKFFFVSDAYDSGTYLEYVVSMNIITF